MRISAIEPIAVSLPMKKPVKMAGETIARADNVLVRVESDTGIVGWGEAASAPTMTGETVASMLAAVRHLAPGLLEHAAGDFVGIAAAMDALMYGNSGAKAAIEMALHDLVGRATGRPVHALLGDKKRGRVPLLAVIGGGDAGADVREALEQKAAGYVIFKVKVGIATPEADAMRTCMVCEALGAGCLVSADANQGFTVDEALRYARAVAGSGLGFIEQPIAAHDLAGMAQVAASSSVPLGADEGIHSRADIERHHAVKAAQGVSLKAIKLGGLRALLGAAQRCAELGMRINISCKTGESSLASAAALHVAAVVPELAWGLTVTHSGLAEDVASVPLGIEHGQAAVLDGPGLGVEVDEPRLRRWEAAARRVA